MERGLPDQVNDRETGCGFDPRRAVRRQRKAPREAGREIVMEDQEYLRRRQVLLKKAQRMSAIGFALSLISLVLALKADGYFF